MFQLRFFFLVIAILVFLFPLQVVAKESVIPNRSGSQSITNTPINHEEENQSQENNVEILHYSINIKIDHEKGVLFGKSTTKFKPLETNKDLLLVSLLTAGTVEDLEINGRKTTDFTFCTPPNSTASTAQQAHLKMLVLTVPKEEFQHRSDPLEIAISYKDPNFSGTDTNPEDMTPFSTGQISRTNSFSSHMYPYPFVPFHSARAADIFISTNLKDGVAISSGKLLNVVERNGYKTFHYHTDDGSGELPYPFAIAAYNTLETLASDGKTKLQLFFFPEDRVFAEQRFSLVQKIFSNYVELFGKYPFPKLAIVETAPKEGTIGLAAQSVILLTQKKYFGMKLDENDLRITNDPLFSLADEINHQWNFYKIHSPTYLAEGISRYSDSLTAEHFGGAPALTNQMLQTTKSFLYLIGKMNIEDTPITDPNVFPALYFLKGAMALHMLRGMFGFEEFKTAMRLYFTENEGKACDRNDLRMVFERVVKADLSWFFHQWFEMKGWPKLKMQFWITKSESNMYSLKIIVRQQQEPLFRLDNVPFQVEAKNGEKKTFYFNIKPQKTQDFELNLEKEPKDVILDPDGWVLKEMVD
ncbi:MAG: hypothetical protein HQM08_16015 [Candidatus Riflebacteria bacterium]|nr:hypothetical protein [Candidatus Riflebacteria bacterium]